MIEAQNKTEYDASRFMERLQAVEVELRDMAAELQQVTRVSSIMPQIETELGNLRDTVEQAVSADAKQSARDLAAAFRKLKRDLDDAQYASKLDGLDTEVREMGIASSDLQGKVAEFEAWSEKWLGRIAGDNAKVAQQMVGLEDRIRALEGRKIDQPVTQKNDDFDVVAREVSARFGKMQDDTFGMMQAAIEQLAQEIRNEGHHRASVIGQMQQQTADLHQNAVESLSKTSTEVKSLQVKFGESLAGLSSSISDAFEQTQSEANTFIEDLEGRATTLVTDTGDNFKAINSEIVETVQTMRTNATDAFKLLETGAGSESETRKRNSQEIIHHYHNFEDLITQEAQLVRGKADESFAGIVSEATMLINETTAPLAKGLDTINSVVNKLDEIEMVMQKCEDAFKDLNLEVSKEVTSLTEHHKQLAKDITFLAGNTARGCSDLEERLSRLEGSPDGAALSSQVHGTCTSFVQDMETQMDTLEQELGDIMANLGGFLSQTSGFPAEPEDVQFVFEPSLESRSWMLRSQEEASQLQPEFHPNLSTINSFPQIFEPSSKLDSQEPSVNLETDNEQNSGNVPDLQSEEEASDRDHEELSVGDDDIHTDTANFADQILRSSTDDDGPIPGADSEDEKFAAQILQSPDDPSHGGSDPEEIASDDQSPDDYQNPGHGSEPDEMESDNQPPDEYQRKGHDSDQEHQALDSDYDYEEDSKND